MTRSYRECRLILGVVIASRLAVGVATAQTSDQRPITGPSVAGIDARVPVGDVVSVTDATGATIKGALAALTHDAVEVTIKAGVRRVSAADVRRIQWQQADSSVTGVLIGAGIGAIPGIYWLAMDPNECRGMCPEEYMLVAVGAVVGGIIDHAIKRRVTVYSAEPPSGAASSVVIGPIAHRHRKGVQVAVKF